MKYGKEATTLGDDVDVKIVIGVNEDDSIVVGVRNIFSVDQSASMESRADELARVGTFAAAMFNVVLQTYGIEGELKDSAMELILSGLTHALDTQALLIEGSTPPIDVD